MIELYSPRGEMELLFLRSILDDAGIPYFIHNDTFGSLYPGRFAESYNRKILYVPEPHLGEARSLLREFFQRTGEPPEVLAPSGAAALLDRALQEAERRWPPHRRGPWARRLWRALAAWGLNREPGPRDRFHLIRNESPRNTDTVPPARDKPPLRLL